MTGGRGSRRVDVGSAGASPSRLKQDRKSLSSARSVLNSRLFLGPVLSLTHGFVEQECTGGSYVQ